MGRTSTKCRCSELIVGARVTSFQFTRYDKGEIIARGGIGVVFAVRGNKKVLDPDGVRSIEARRAGIFSDGAAAGGKSYQLCICAVKGPVFGRGVDRGELFSILFACEVKTLDKFGRSCGIRAIGAEGTYAHHHLLGGQTERQDAE
jgi:hypothetical protein